MVSRVALAAAWTIVFLAAPLPACAQRWAAQAPLEVSVALGLKRTMWSSVLQEPRQLLISLPANYEQCGRAYPVMFLLDAELQFVHVAGVLQFLGAFNQRIPEMILVGIVNTDRGRDLVPAARNPAWRDHEMWRAEYERSDAASFLKFFGDELIPWVEARYRTQPYRTLVGHSFGGIFSTFAMVERPELFQAHIAISPSLWYDGEALISRIEAGIRRLRSPPWLFLSWADHEENIRSTTKKLVQSLTIEPPPALRWAHRYYRGDDHMSTPHRALYDALELQFAQWRMPLRPSGNPSLSEVEAHHRDLSKRYGFDVKPTAAALDNVAYGLMERGDASGAIDALRRSVSENRCLPETHRALGAALEKVGRREEAIAAYEEALRVALDADSSYRDLLGEYRRKVEELR